MGSSFFFFCYVSIADYKTVTEEIEEFCRNSTPLGSRNVNYMQGNAETFGGNFSFRKRLSFFDYRGDGIGIPCGFFKKFPISFAGQFPYIGNVNVLFQNCCIFSFFGIVINIWSNEECPITLWLNGNFWG